VADTLIFYNTLSGSASASKLQCIKKNFPHARLILIQKKVTAEDILTSIREEELLIAVGGDGTVSLVANACIQKNRTLGIIPAGTGNIMAKQFKIPVQTEQACKLLLEKKKPLCIDAFKINNQYRLMNIAVGSIAHIMKNTAAKDKKTFGLLAYLYKGLQHVFKVDKKQITLELDGTEHTLHAEEILITNFAYTGIGHIKIDNTSSPHDGVCEVFVFGRRHLFDTFHMGAAIINQDHQKRTVLKKYQFSSTLRISTTPHLEVQADGDHVGKTPITVTLEKQCLFIKV
jgi:YegS/Rv2252/BmrU family lipid kinase